VVTRRQQRHSWTIFYRPQVTNHWCDIMFSVLTEISDSLSEAYDEHVIIDSQANRTSETLHDRDPVTTEHW